MAFLLKGSEVTKAMKDKMIIEVEELKSKGILPTLALVRLGERPDDLSYERGAIKRCEGVGINCRVFKFSESISVEELINETNKINNDKSIHGILMFRPLPKHINEDKITRAISPDKDVDCMNPINIAKVFAGDESGFAPCTPEAVIEMIEHYKIPVEGKNVVVIGRSMVVGKPLSMLLLKKHGTITVCHTRTRNLEEICKRADILVAAAGKAKMINKNFVSPGVIIFDVGINVDPDGKLCGDVDLDSVVEIVEGITPVPGGVGTVTTSVLAKHVVRAAEKARQSNVAK
ncbi:MAG TPA: bifunctional 5,10-methylenetetrahydrofolate dehydrogenase/5,10-methenyltetrahydrofolate cyclohydrolase [Clostridiaceae bacterium]|jgi:methylenetetrahydrofolate dehydrogenase (NADP+)/methenyltetrahydrofolate cyclohydrolase|nr:bifunctional 5,10-methylenetetrahydrofolate dehydrogenase/5,10-methenyltetrahydrofolate cyclohydrolase [Clostridiaceae bacterium]